MNAPYDFAAKIAESRAAHLSPAIGAVWLSADGTIQTTAHGQRATGEPAATTNDLWHIGSCTKAMTATLLARLIEQGRARFDMPLGEALPTLAARMHPAFRATPLRAVLTHGAGIARDPSDSTFRVLRRSGATASAQRLFLAGEALREAPRPDVGYSNLGYIVLGAVIERLTGRSWEAALARQVMIPLGIGRFGFGPPGSDQPSGHRRIANAWKTERGDNPQAYGPAGRVHLALDEWGRFLRAHLGHGPTGFLKRETLSTLHTAGSGNFAMGWIRVRDARSGQTRLHHTGSNTAWYAQALLVPSAGIGIGVVCNAYDEALTEAVGDLCNALISPEREGPP